MPKTDPEYYALVVGIRDYPAFPDAKLEGPVDDAKAFRKWVIDPNGGKVPARNVKCITSQQPRPTTGQQVAGASCFATDARPSEYEIECEFRRFHEAVHQSKQRGLGPRLGRRLYIYFSGHGFAPDRDESAVCAANFSRIETGSHVLAKSHAEWLANAGAFEEIVLFTDSCRRSEGKIRQNWKTESITPVPGATPPSELYLFAAGFDQETREVLKDGSRRGPFTLALLEGLRGGAGNADGQVTAESLEEYLKTAVADLLDEKDRADPHVAKRPQTARKTGDFVIATPKRARNRQLPVFKVRVHVPPALLGANISIMNSRLNEVKHIPSAPASFELQLKRDFYEIQVDFGEFSRSRPFEVTGAREEMRLDAI